jgi:hypothetical protein
MTPVHVDATLPDTGQSRHYALDPNFGTVGRLVVDTGAHRVQNVNLATLGEGVLAFANVVQLDGSTDSIGCALDASGAFVAAFGTGCKTLVTGSGFLPDSAITTTSGFALVGPTGIVRIDSTGQVSQINAPFASYRIAADADDSLFVVANSPGLVQVAHVATTGAIVGPVEIVSSQSNPMATALAATPVGPVFLGNKDDGTGSSVPFAIRTDRALAVDPSYGAPGGLHIWNPRRAFPSASGVIVFDNAGMYRLDATGALDPVFGDQLNDASMLDVARLDDQVFAEIFDSNGPIGLRVVDTQGRLAGSVDPVPASVPPSAIAGSPSGFIVATPANSQILMFRFVRVD